MKIVKVRGNVKKGFDGEIGEKTLIVGPNGSGKSTVVNTIELALTGRAGDIAGRVDVAREVDVMSLATDDTLFAEVTFDHGLTASYQTSGSTAKAKKATHLPPPGQGEDVLPIRTLREAMMGSAATARKFLLVRMGEGLTREMGAPEEHDDLYWQMMKSIPDSVPAADALVTVLEKAGSRARDAMASAKAAKQASSFVTQGSAIPPLKADLDGAKKEAADLERVWQEAVKASSKADWIPARKARLEKALAEADALVAEYGPRKSVFDQLEPLEEAHHKNVTEMLVVADASIAEGSCLVCGGGVDGLGEVVEAVRNSLESELNERERRAEMKSELDRLRYRAEEKMREIQVLEDEIAKAESEDAPYDGPSVEEAHAAYTAAKEKATDIAVRMNAWDSARKAQTQAQQAEVEAGQWKELKDALEGKVASLLEVARTKFVQKVQSYLPSTDSFALRLVDGDREVVQFGLMRDGKLHTALSGAEWARVMAALASACVPADQYACIIPEERAFDSVTLGKVMRALGETPHQVILTSPVAPKSPPKDWVIIRRGEEE